MTEMEVMRVLVAMTLIEAAEPAALVLQRALDAFASQNDTVQSLLPPQVDRGVLEFPI